MEGGRDVDDGGVAGAVAQERRWRGGGGDDEESSGLSNGGGGGGGGVELSLRLRTGADDGAATAAALSPLPPPVAEARRNMTIFYNGRVCAADVTEIQARAIISMASEETLADHRGRRRRQQQQLTRGDGGDGDGRQQDGDSSSSSTTTTSAVALARRCARGRGLVGPAAVSPSLLAVVGTPRRGGFAGAVAAAPAVEIDQAADAGLSMKRSLQLFLQKRKARTAAAAAPPYAGGRQAQAVRR